MIKKIFAVFLNRKNFFRGSVILAFTAVLSNLTGLLRDRTSAHIFGASTALDAFNAAIIIPNLLLNIAKYENSNNLMPGITAGDVLYDAYNAARDRRDSRTLYKIADYEGSNNLIYNLTGDSIRREARNIEYGY